MMKHARTTRGAMGVLAALGAGKVLAATPELPFHRPLLRSQAWGAGGGRPLSEIH
jgi:hypothetical protein